MTTLSETGQGPFDTFVEILNRIYDRWLNDNIVFYWDENESLITEENRELCLDYTIENIGNDYLRFRFTEDDLEDAMFDSYYDIVTKRSFSE